MKNWLAVLVIAVLVGLTLRVSKSEPKTITEAKTPVTVVTPEPTKTEEATNGEGNLKLVETKSKAAEGRVSYEFKVIDSLKKTETPIYQTVADAGSVLSVPYNSWSPDYRQIFIRADGPEGQNYYIFKSDGQTYADGKKYILVGDYWDKTKATNKIERISGWAGNDLLMVYTNKEDGSHGPAYWFVTSSRKFMQVREL